MRAIIKKLYNTSVDKVWDAQGGEFEAERKVTGRIKSLRKVKGYERDKQIGGEKGGSMVEDRNYGNSVGTSRSVGILDSKTEIHTGMRKEG